MCDEAVYEVRRSCATETEPRQVFNKKKNAECSAISAHLHARTGRTARTITFTTSKEARQKCHSTWDPSPAAVAVG